ncbi:MAG: DUF2075 domain-containing protein [Vicinamibacterales bacterium]|jgi:hypothetical protein
MPELLIPGAYYAADVATFIAASPEQILGVLALRSNFNVDQTQRDAWVGEIEILKDALTGTDGTLILEFDVPRIGSRIDAVLLSGPAVFVIEFKVGERHRTRDHFNQVWDYALDLKNFHQASHGAPIFPILLPTEADHSEGIFAEPSPDGVFPPAFCNGDGLKQLIAEGLKKANGPIIEASAWANAPYRPTPTIIEAARALYSRHSVDAIARHDAGAQNLSVTSQRIEALIDTARKEGQKIIIFVTGVPGAGKTLVGLNVATQNRADTPVHAVFLSGNGPLVAVLREALVRDELQRRRHAGEQVRKGEVGQKVKAFIQNVHHFRDAGLRDVTAPVDHVVIFDEAQRAWDLRQTANFMLRRKKRADFDQSEPQVLVSYLDRHKDWAVVICLVGGGQEINRGEAGIAGWLDAMETSFQGWTAYASPHLSESEPDTVRAIEDLRRREKIKEDPALHLAVSMRSFRAENVSSFVKAVLDLDTLDAQATLRQMAGRFPMAVTRDLFKAKSWIREHARGTERVGLVASSGAQRLKPHAIDIRVNVDPVHWFLSEPDDLRGSNFLEDAATEFQVQGLEVDWACVTWDADLRLTDHGWSHHSFVGNRWTTVRNLDRQKYLVNAYRVLLTRARQGMVIFVPPGEAGDATRPPEYYQRTYEYFKDLGIPAV